MSKNAKKKNSFEMRENKLTGDSLSMMPSIPTSQFEDRKIKQNCD